MMPKLAPAEIALHHLDRGELVWLVKTYCRVSHRMICEARYSGLLETTMRELAIYSERARTADDLDVKVTEALEFATAATVISDRARSSRWSAYETAQAAARRARDKARASWNRFKAAEAEAEKMRTHLDRLHRWADA